MPLDGEAAPPTEAAGDQVLRTRGRRLSADLDAVLTPIEEA
jgi:hypothetical protein